MTWENHGTVWEIDHIIPLLWNNPTIGDIEIRMQFDNCQPFWKKENRAKSLDRLKGKTILFVSIRMMIKNSRRVVSKDTGSQVTRSRQKESL